MAYLKTFSGSILLSIDDDKIKEYGGRIIATYDQNYIKDFGWQIRYRIDGFISRREIMALIAVLYAV